MDIKKPKVVDTEKDKRKEHISTSENIKIKEVMDMSFNPNRPDGTVQVPIKGCICERCGHTFVEYGYPCPLFCPICGGRVIER